MSELAILVGALLVVVGVVAGGRRVLVVGGVGLIVLATLEFTAREHVTGFRSHAALLALVPTVLVHALGAVLLGAGASALLFAADAVVFAGAASWLTQRFRRARRDRRAAPPA